MVLEVKLVGAIHVNQRARLPNKVKGNRETFKSVENACALYYNTRRKSNSYSYAYENGMSNVLLKGYSGVNPVVMNCKITHS